MGLRLAISNIAWSSEFDQSVYEYLKKNNIPGLEIAPTRIFDNKPYEELEAAKLLGDKLKDEYGLTVCSLQSIWFGKTEKIFGSAEERKELIDYTKQAILFAEAIGAGNLVFGCPKNRNLESKLDRTLEESFFKEIASFAERHNTVVAMEANPTIYGTNYINYTRDAIELVRRIDSRGFKLNLDFGTIIQNSEDLDFIISNIDAINHVHISEPYLNKIVERNEHKVLIKALNDCRYSGFVSIEMKKQENIEDVYSTIEYLMDITRE